jgi:hypothetical protein
MNLRRMMMMARGFVLVVTLGILAALAGAQKRDQIVKPMAGPRATALQITSLYITPSTTSQRIDKVQIGREMVVADKSGDWLKVFANTDIEEVHNDRDEPMVGEENAPTPPISGWVQAKGIVMDDTPNGDQIIMGTAAIEEELASDPRGPVNSAKSARLLYRRVLEMFPNSALAPQAAWRAADIAWQIQKSENSSLKSNRERDPHMRPDMDDDELKKVIKVFPRTRWAAFAAFDLIDPKLCGDWEGLTQCPEKESDIYLKYADEYPDGPRTSRALYEAVYRMAVLTNMYQAGGNDKKSQEAHQRASEVATRLRSKFADSDYSWRAGALVYKLDQGIPVYGNDLQ